MDKVTIISNDNKIEFGIGQHKYIVSNRHQRFFEINQVYKKVFNKESDSEYDLETQRLELMINDKMIDLKRHAYWNVNEYFDLDQDLKLSSKSLTLKYLEAKLGEIEYCEIISTINGMFREATDKINELTQNELLCISLNDFNLKMIIKNLSIKLVDDENELLPHNLSYEEVMCYQITMVSEIARGNKLVTNWIVMMLPNITDKISETIKKCPDNVKFIIFSRGGLKVDLKDILLYNNKCLDLAEETDIYEELVLNYHCHTTLELMKVKLKEYLVMTDNSSNELNKYL